MKNTTITICMVLFALILSRAQERKFDFGFSLFPNYSAGIISNDGSIPNSVESGFQELETWKPSFSASIFVEYKLNKKSLLGLGMGYQNNGEKTKKIDLIFGANQIVDSSIPDEVRFVYNHHNLEIPLYYKYLFGKKLYVIMGTSGIVNVSNTASIIKYFEDGTKEKNTEEDNSTDFRRFNFSVNLGFGLNYLKTEKLALFVNPYIQYGVLGISKSAPLNRNFLSLGISTGIKI